MLSRFFTFLLVCLVGFTSQAEIVFSPTLSYYEKSEAEAGAETKRKISEVALRLGYLFDMGLYLGVNYALSDEEFATGSADYNISLTAGYKKGPAYVMASYILDAQKDISTGGLKYSDGTGYQLDFGYLVPITETFHLGPQLTYKKVSYDNFETQGIGVPTDREDTYLVPHVVLWFQM